MAPFLALLTSLLLAAAPANAARLNPRSVSPTPTTSSLGPCKQTSFTIPNGDFEDGALGPWTPEGRNTSVTITSSGDSDSAALLIRGTGPGAYGGVWNQAISVCAAAQYELSWKYRINESAPGCIATVEATQFGHVKQYSSFAMNPTNGWKAGKRLRIREGIWHLFGISASINANSAPRNSCQHAAIEFDSFELTWIKSGDAPGCPKEAYIENGDFESGTLDSWTVVGPQHASAAAVSPGYNGSKALARASIEAYNSNVTTNAIGIYNYLNGACLDYSYNVSLVYRWNGDVEAIKGACYIGISSSYCKAFAFSRPPVTGWHTFSQVCIATKNAVNETGDFNKDIDVELAVICQGEHDAPAFSVDFDDVTIELMQ